MNLIARTEERKLLENALKKTESQFIAIYGRRRVGKTFLVREVYSGGFCFTHTGYHNLAKADQLQGFFKSLKKAGLPAGYECPKNWMEAFDLLEAVVEQSKEEKKILFLDELSWMDTPRCDLVPALEHFWNAFAAARKDVVLILCSSATSWVLNRVIQNRGGLHNRLTLSIHLAPFTLFEVEEYVRALGVTLNRVQIATGYMAIGGVPYYWSHLEKGMSIEQYLDYLFYRKGALLRDEFKWLFQSLFAHPEVYIRIIYALSQKRKGLTRQEILDAIGLKSAGGISAKLKELENCDFIRTFTSYGERKETLYQLTDPFVFFHYHFLEHRSMDAQYWVRHANDPRVNTWKGLSFELVCLLHIQEIKSSMGIASVETEAFSFSIRENREKGIHGSQTDLVIKRADRITNLVEIKYAQEDYLVTKSLDDAMRRKRADYVRATGTRDAIQLTIIAPYGIADNSYAGNWDCVLTVDDLFRR